MENECELAHTALNVMAITELTGKDRSAYVAVIDSLKGPRKRTSFYFSADISEIHSLKGPLGLTPSW